MQSSDLKEKLEGLKLTKNDMTSMSLDIKNMYLSVQVKLIKKALKFYSKSLLPEDKRKIELGMDMTQLGMKNTLVSYRDKYFNYKGAAKGDDLTIEDVVLAIRGYESAFLVDLVASYLFEMTDKKFIEAQYKGIYRDD
eukprot:1908679-Ditylum_brightwellii.AAC.1